MADRKRETERKITVGKVVTYEIGGTIFRAHVIEDRGTLGGKHIWRLRKDDSEFELTEDSLRLAV